MVVSLLSGTVVARLWCFGRGRWSAQSQTLFGGLKPEFRVVAGDYIQYL